MKYLVELHRTIRSTAEVEVEADSTEEAKKKAYELWEQDSEEPSWDVMEEDCQIGYATENTDDES